MPNWIEHNPTKSLIVYTITLAGAIFAILYFVLFENQSYLHKTEKENLKTQIQTLNERIDLLQYDNIHLIKENNQLKYWLKSTPNSFEFLKDQIKMLENQVSNPEQPVTAPKTETSKYTNVSKNIASGQAYLDQKTGVSIGINEISIHRTASGIIHLPNTKEVKFSKAKPGTQWEFNHNGIHYSLVLLEVNYIGDQYRVVLKEK